MRRTLSRVATNAIADEVLAVYFLECRKELLVEWLDQVGVEHKDGTLDGRRAAAAGREEAARRRRELPRAGDDPDRDLLLRAFAAQDAIEWPVLDALLGGGQPAAAASAAPAPAAPEKPKTRPKPLPGEPASRVRIAPS